MMLKPPKPLRHCRGNNMAFELKGKTALVTGAGQGVGLGIARGLAAQGAKVWVNDIDAVKADHAVAVIREQGGEADSLCFDVTDFEQVQGRVEAAGQIDILVNNVGNAGAQAMGQKMFADMSPQQWQAFIDVNLYGVLNCTHAVLSGMRERQWGRVITISSEAGRSGLNIGVSIYGAAKAGAINFMRHLSQEVGGDHITANSVALGLMDNVPEEFTSKVIRGIPMGRLGSPQDAAAAVIYLASEEAGWVTGQVLTANGGSSAF
jgi:NAD(P)-dependent dehydrogenase (short-subunit alcohol dehydrogenase family)